MSNRAALTLDSPEEINAEIRWVAREAIALRTDRDPDRRARFLDRKHALLAVVEGSAEKSPAELQLDEGRDNHFGEQKS